MRVPLHAQGSERLRVAAEVCASVLCFNMLIDRKSFWGILFCGVQIRSRMQAAALQLKSVHEAEDYSAAALASGEMSDQQVHSTPPLSTPDKYLPDT